MMKKKPRPYEFLTYPFIQDEEKRKLLKEHDGIKHFKLLMLFGLEACFEWFKEKERDTLEGKEIYAIANFLTIKILKNLFDKNYIKTKNNYQRDFHDDWNIIEKSLKNIKQFYKDNLLTIDNKIKGLVNNKKKTYWCLLKLVKKKTEELLNNSSNIDEKLVEKAREILNIKIEDEEPILEKLKEFKELYKQSKRNKDVIKVRSGVFVYGLLVGKIRSIINKKVKISC